METKSMPLLTSCEKLDFCEIQLSIAYTCYLSVTLWKLVKGDLPHVFYYFCGNV